MDDSVSNVIWLSMWLQRYAATSFASAVCVPETGFAVSSDGSKQMALK